MIGFSEIVAQSAECLTKSLEAVQFLAKTDGQAALYALTGASMSSVANSQLGLRFCSRHNICNLIVLSGLMSSKLFCCNCMVKPPLSGCGNPLSLWRYSLTGAASRPNSKILSQSSAFSKWRLSLIGCSHSGNILYCNTGFKPFMVCCRIKLSRSPAVIMLSRLCGSYLHCAKTSHRSKPGCIAGLSSGGLSIKANLGMTFASIPEMQQQQTDLKAGRKTFVSATERTV